MIYRKGQLPNPHLTDKKTLRRFDDDLLRYLNEQDENLDSIFKINVTDGQFLTFTSHATPGTDVTVPHNLGRTPTGYIPVTKDKAADIYHTTAMDDANLYLKCDVATAAIKLWVF